MPVVMMDEGAVYYDRSKAETGPVLVLVHGSGGDHTHWPEGLRHHHGMRVFAPDMPGHGRSAGTGCESVEDYADVIDRFVGNLGIEKAAVAGHSLGGAVAMTLALMRPEWLSGIILVGTGARLRVHPKILDGLTTAFEDTVEVILGALFGPETPPSAVTAVRRQLRENTPRIIHGDYLACDRFDIMERMGEIVCPTRVISATDDRLTPLKYGEYLRQGIPGARFTLIEGAGHMMAIEKPNAVTNAVTRFLGVW